MEAHKLRRRQNISTVITSGRSNLVERIMATGRRGDKQKETAQGRKGIEGHCGEEKKGDRMIRKGRRAGRHQRLLRFSGKDEKDKWKRKRARWWERNNEWQRKANEGKGTTREARREERRKKGRGRLVGSPASLRDLHEGRPTRSCKSSASRASSTLGTDLRGE